ncbi:hypothetical protein DESUT3_13050 [Desulfuromonas versatilis]|uniref:Uncharacterized protein n=1 Tax=Desulfuromonas versatilis TaxID=2802975 RepID=A0ABM8HNA7_9BACT|nr:hypothetical protein [Desulfuromonas versatilis]BCR04236.1 hypothetical protein DESUT3_13050 [Desulfuromonas versatilis]
MFADENISLECPYCGEAIYQPLSWFQKAYSTCPVCQKGLAAGQFAARVKEIEQALDAHIEEMVGGARKTGCCGGKSSCC